MVVDRDEHSPYDIVAIASVLIGEVTTDAGTLGRRHGDMLMRGMSRYSAPWDDNKYGLLDSLPIEVALVAVDGAVYQSIPWLGECMRTNSSSCEVTYRPRTLEPQYKH